MKRFNILGISGSLRPDSTNTVILRAFEAFLPANTNFKIFHGLDEIPHFSPGLDDTAAVTAFKTAIQQADGVIICTPEYAFGVPGTLKNALDWTVASGDLNDKPVSAVSASPLNTGGEKALASLLLTLTALGTRKNDDSSLSIPNIKHKIDANQQVSDQETLVALRHQIDNLLAIIAS
ncbi:NADPH-dependent FMN reductase [Dyadobacter pollutisoli]|uniref:NAD(P)H-dependent oxidoreductase n=1 Tax=Dyadobacter pollutisoli TaxID=2910158 RepID=A0A9E8NG12_9BACT|nr:NADPH-dependent FMN reductase [Dyadobacter pollutisoli]WAC14286.1 NAD(P)H-dependent oxidoreductase [Dyadobacter pollutisoli]